MMASAGRDAPKIVNHDRRSRTEKSWTEEARFLACWLAGLLACLRGFADKELQGSRAGSSEKPSRSLMPLSDQGCDTTRRGWAS